MKKQVLPIITLVAIVALALAPIVRAWDCVNYNFHVTRKGLVSASNNSASNEPAQNATVKINNDVFGPFAVPALAAGSSADIGTVPTPGDAGFTWYVDGDQDCDDSDSYDPQTTATPTNTNTPDPTATWTPEPTTTNTPTNTPSPTDTNTPTSTNTATSTQTETPSATSTGTFVSPTPSTTPQPTDTPVPPTNGPNPTFTPQNTSTPQPTVIEPRASVGMARDFRAPRLGSLMVDGQEYVLYGCQSNKDGVMSLPDVGAGICQGNIRLHKWQGNPRSNGVGRWVDEFHPGAIVTITFLGTVRQYVAENYSRHDYWTPIKLGTLNVGTCYTINELWHGIETYQLRQINFQGNH